MKSEIFDVCCLSHIGREAEIRADIRSLDPVEELAFVATECERLGAWTAQKGR